MNSGNKQAAMPRPGTSCMIHAAWLVPQRFAGFQGEGDPLLSLALAAQGEKCFTLQIQEILLRDQAAGSKTATAQNVRGFAGDLLVVFGGKTSFAHQENASLERGQSGQAGGRNLRALDRRDVALFGQQNSLGFGVQKQVFAVA